MLYHWYEMSHAALKPARAVAEHLRTLVEVGRGRWPCERMPDVLAARDRRQAGPTAPARGLFLVRVEYGDL